MPDLHVYQSEGCDSSSDSRTKDQTSSGVRLWDDFRRLDAVDLTVGQGLFDPLVQVIEPAKQVLMPGFEVHY